MSRKPPRRRPTRKARASHWETWGCHAVKVGVDLAVVLIRVFIGW
ncbi:hypothetical protein ACFYUR_18940 [Micromonospora haikouensis]